MSKQLDMSAGRAVLDENTASRSTVVKIARLCGVKKIQVAAVAGLGLAGVLFDALGLTMLYPIGEYLLNEGDMDSLLATSRVWGGLHTAFGWFGVEPGIAAVVALSAGFLLFRQAVTYLRLVYQASLSFMQARRIRRLLFLDFLAARLDYQERLYSGPFANSMTTETTQASQSISTLLEFLNACAFTVGYVLLLFWLSPLAALAVIAVLGAVGFGMRNLLRRVRDLSREIVTANADYAQHFLERCRAGRLIRLTQSEDFEVYNATRLLNRQEKKNVQSIKAIAVTEIGIEPLALVIGIPLLVAAVVVYGADLPTVGMFLVILARLAPMVKQSMRGWQAYLRVRASAENILAVAEELASAREQSAGVSSLPLPVEEIRFEDVSFSYPDADRQALDGINMSIPGKQMTAIVGPSGSGKSTLIDLLPRLRVPTLGRVTVNGTPLEDIRIDDLRAQCAYVSQSPTLLSGTIAEHIGYGMGELDQKSIEEAANLANAAEFIDRLPKGYATHLGESGTGLSGGQRQRVELARALARRSSILILDEPTSNVDGESAARIADALKKIREQTDTTIIIVGHQLRAIEGADQIVVIRNGRVEAHGKHEDLAAQPGWYRSTWSRQTGVDPRADDE